MSTIAFFFGVVSHMTRDLCLFISTMFFHTSSIHGGEFGMAVKKNRSEFFSFRGKSQKACFSVDIDSRDRSLFFNQTVVVIFLTNFKITQQDKCFSYLYFYFILIYIECIKKSIFLVIYLKMHKNDLFTNRQKFKK